MEVKVPNLAHPEGRARVTLAAAVDQSGPSWADLADAIENGTNYGNDTILVSAALRAIITTEEARLAALSLVEGEREQDRGDGQAQGWTYEVHELSEGYSAIVYDEHGMRIADHLSEDRARLIAAAPDLLKACADWIDWLKPDSPWREDAADYETQMLDAMRAAIAKAEGC